MPVFGFWPPAQRRQWNQLLGSACCQKCWTVPLRNVQNKTMKQTEAPEHWSVSSAGFLWGGGLRSAASCELTGCCWTSWRITGLTCSTAATLSASRPARRRCGSDAPARKSTTSWTWEQRERFLTCCRVFKYPLTLFYQYFQIKISLFLQKLPGHVTHNQHQNFFLCWSNDTQLFVCQQNIL